MSKPFSKSLPKLDGQQQQLNLGRLGLGGGQQKQQQQQQFGRSSWCPQPQPNRLNELKDI